MGGMDRLDAGMGNDRLVGGEDNDEVHSYLALVMT